MKNDLLCKYPSLEKEWNVYKNGLIPNNITLYSKKRYYFNCENCNGKEYYITLKDWFRRKSHASNICRHYPTNQKRKAKLKMSLAEHSSHLILEWSENNKEDYNLINYGSEKIVEWKCQNCDYFFNQKICKRSVEKVGCPYCAGKKANKFNSLEQKYPELSKRLLNPNPCDITSLSSKIGVWKCLDCNENYKSKIFQMVKSYENKNSGCPFCTGKKVNDKNNLLKTHPKICLEWDRNKNIKGPENYTAGSGSRYKVWWLCKEKSHSWEASINVRTGKNKKSGSSCPYCSKRISKLETEWLDYLKIDKKYRQVYVKLGNKKYSVDAYVSETNTIYEFWGDYYHGNPKVYNLDDYNKTCKKTFRELYEKTIEKQNKIITNGYNFISIWEFEWNSIKNI